MSGLTRTLRSVCCGVGILVAAPPAWAQTIARSFEQLEVLVKPGSTVTVTDAAGIERRGRIAALSASSIELDLDGGRRAFVESDVRTISQRRAIPGKGAKWGFFIGAGIGALGAVAIALDDEGDYSEFGGKGGLAAGVVAGYGGFGAAVGVGIGALLRPSRVVYAGRPNPSTALRLSPILAPGRKGAGISLSF